MTAHTIQPVYTPLDLLLLVFAAVIVPALSWRTARALAKARPDSLVPRYASIIARGVLVALVVLLDWHWAGRPFATLGLDWPIGFRGRIGFAFDAVLAGAYGTALFLSKLSPERIATARRQLDSLRVVPAKRGELLMFPFVSLNAGIFEELLYRGFLIWLLAPPAGVWGAVALSSALFGLGHVYQGARGILRTALLGLGLALGYVLTQSLWWLILAHALVNLFGGLFAWRLKRAAA